MNIEITKRDFWRLVNKKINRSINSHHVINVISILFEEMANDLKDGKEINIFNFGTISLKKTKPRKYVHIISKNILESAGRKLLKFKVSKKFKKKILERVLVDKK